MARRSATIGLLVALFVLPLYPKVSLIGVAGTYIPVRIDDLVIAVAAALWLIALVGDRRVPDGPRRVVAAVTLWLGVTLVALLVGVFVLHSIGLATGVAFWAKPIEYLLLGLMAYDMVRNHWLPIRHVLGAIFASAAIVIGYGFLEHFGIVPNLPGDVVPPGGVTSTLGDFHELASYLGLVILLVICLYHDAETRWTRIALIALGVGGVLTLFWSGTRSEYIALFLVLLGLLTWRPTRRPAAVTAVGMVLTFLSPIAIYAAYYLANPSAAQQAAASGQIPDGPFYNVTVRFTPVPLLYSLGERFGQKWPALIQAGMRDPILGLGPSAATEAADGYYVRTFVESGLLGIVAFVAVQIATLAAAAGAARRASGSAKSLAVAALCATVFLTLVGILIDTWVASRVMELFWPLLGLSLGAVAAQVEAEEQSTAEADRQPLSAVGSA